MPPADRAAAALRPLPPLRRHLQTGALVAFRRLPAPLRRGLVRAGTPSYTVGAVCALEHEGALLVLRQPHRTGWSFPGGLLDRGEGAAEGVEREMREEVGLQVQVGLPLTCQVDAALRRVDVVYRVRVAERPGVAVGGEARSAAWLPPAEVAEDADAPTRQILAVLARASAPGGADGRVLAEG